MISNINGVVMSTCPDYIVVGVGGVGMKVLTTTDVIAEASSNEFIALSTTLVVREDSLTLYGFATDSARDLFELLQTVSGVGPKVALAMLSTLGADGVIRAIAQEDTKAITTVPGIAAKGAARVILDLSGKLPEYRGDAANVDLADQGSGTSNGWSPQLQEALEGLGWTQAQAQLAVAYTEQHVANGAGFDPNTDMSATLSFALRSLVKS
ncbi:MAG: Holliday junction branch migration protein RuvA [Candidatus Nanopelagicales bacterium]